MTYSGVLVSFGVLAWTTSQALRGAATPGMFRQLGITGTRGYHLAAYNITLTVLAAPIDDLWHRTFGLDVTLWSPSHLLGLVGGILNAVACCVIACEVYPARSRARLVGLVLALVVTAHLSKLRIAPVLVVVTVFVIVLAGAGVSRAGFCLGPTQSFLAEEIAKDPADRQELEGWSSLAMVERYAHCPGP